MDIEYYMKLQNAYGTKNRREKELVNVNAAMAKHFEDTFDTVDVFVGGKPMQLMVIRDTDSNTYKKKIKARKCDKFRLGDYVEWEGQKWIISLLDPDTRTWNRGYMYLCTLPLHWQNNNGEIIERWAYSEDFTKYSNGITGTDTIKMGDNQYGILLPADSETKKLKRDMRFAIDFDDSEEPDVYKLTNRKVKLSTYEYFDRGGLITLTMSFDSFNKRYDKKGKLDNGHYVWVCKPVQSISDNITPGETGNNGNFTATISGKTTLRNSHYRDYTATITDAGGNMTSMSNANLVWNVISDFPVLKEVVGNKIRLSINDETLIDSYFTLQILSGITVVTEMTINIVE